MTSCVTGKRIYFTRELAEEALLEHMIKFNHPAGTGPVNVYECDDCGNFHFTSKGPRSEKLEEMKEYIQQQQRIRDWERRLR